MVAQIVENWIEDHQRTEKDRQSLDNRLHRRCKAKIRKQRRRKKRLIHIKARYQALKESARKNPSVHDYDTIFNS